MKTKIVSFLAASCFLVAAAWLVHGPNEAQAVAVDENDRETIRKGLDFLASQQHKDGHWEGDDGNHPVAMTGLAGLAFLMTREMPDRGFGGKRRDAKLDDKHSAIVRKAADWLVDQSRADRDGLIFSGHDSETSRYMLGHGLATIFLAGVCRDETDDTRAKKLRDVLTRAVKYIALAQSTQGGWHDTSKAEGHDFANVQATAIQVQALQATFNAGITLAPATVNDGKQYLEKSFEKRIGAADAAAALTCFGRRGVFDNSSSDMRPDWVAHCRSKIPGGRVFNFGRDELAHYYLAQAEYLLGDNAWSAYRTAMFDRLRESQDKDGTWPAGNGTCVGQVYSAAVWCTVLQLDNNSHPSRQRVPRNID